MTARAGKPGPRSDIDVPVHLLDIAELLFSEHGVNSPSARSIAAAAGIAPGALHHHFGNKEGLVRAVLERRGLGFAARSIDLMELLADNPRTPTIVAVVEAVLTPYLEVLAADPVGGLRWLKVLGELSLADDLRSPELVRSVERLRPLLRAQLERAVGDRLTPDELGVRAGIAIYAVVNSLRSLDSPPFAGTLGPDGVEPGFVEQLIAFTASGIVGRATRRRPSRTP